MSLFSWMQCVLALISCLICLAFSWENSDLDKLDVHLRTYDRRAHPTHNSDKPTLATIEMFIRSFGSVNPATMVSAIAEYCIYGIDYEVDLYLRQAWVDERLRVSNLTYGLDLNDPKLVQMIWKPDVFFPNAKEGEFQYVTVPNVLVRINPEGNILYVLRLKLTFSCMMDLSKYPLDRQICSIELASFAKTTRELKLEWASVKPVKVVDGLKLPQFELQAIVPTNCVETLAIGEYSCLRADFVLERSVGYHLVQSYLPTTLIVVISWVSFWLEIDAIPARVTLGVTTLLTISSESTGIRANLPPVSYVKALDVWMGMCTTFVFAALIEFTIVNYLFRKKEVTSKTHTTTNSHNKWLMLEMGNSVCGKTERATISDGLPNTHASASLPMIHKIRAKRIDRASRIAFPMIFLLFNAVYWSYYMT